MPDLKHGELFLGHTLDTSTGEATGEDLIYDADDLTTHGLIVGMTGSGKTGLGVIMIEEMLLSGVPCLVLDPKGDMGNLLLNFPEHRAQDYAPWVNAGDAKRAGKSVETFAQDAADMWKKGLADSGIASERQERLKASADLTVYTPGSTAGVPLNIVGSLRAPTGDWSQVAEVVRDEIEGFTTSLLGLVDVESDPLSGREHILIANLIEHAWSNGTDLDVATLIGQVPKPPIRKLGVFDVDTFFPDKDRMELALRLNGLVASPSFSSWTSGPPLDVGAMLTPRDGRTPAAIVYMAHLSEAERQFVTTLVLSKAITWMRGLSGTNDLRMLIYMDEVYGFAPPSANPPAKKSILTILKQARAYGVGMVLATQNPVDLDYKAVSNAGTWCIGRLQTERDKARIVEGLASARGNVDVKLLDRTIGGLGKRQFLLQSAHLKEPVLFGTRWAMSYLRGPLMREQIATLMDEKKRLLAAPAVIGARAESATEATAAATAAVRSAHAPTTPATSPAPATTLAADESPVAPKAPSRIPVYYVDPAAPWLRDVGADPSSRRLSAGLVARVHLKFDDRYAEIDHDEEWEAVYRPLGERFDPAAGITVDYDDRDLRAGAPADAVYVLPEAPVDKASYYSEAESALKDHLYRRRTVEVFRNTSLKLYSRVGEDREAFAQRCRAAAEELGDREAAELREKYETKAKRVQDKVRQAEIRLEETEAAYGSRKQQEVLSGAGDLISAFLGGRGRTRSLARSFSRGASRRSMTSRSEARVDTAEEKVVAAQEDLADLEAELADDLSAIDDKWGDVVTEIETIAIGLEKMDISVEELALVWIPVRR